MAKPIQFAEANSKLTGSGDVADLPAYRDGGQVISCWKPTPAELIEILNSGVIWLVAKGVSHPPIMVTGEYPFERALN